MTGRATNPLIDLSIYIISLLGIYDNRIHVLSPSVNLEWGVGQIENLRRIRTSSDRRRIHVRRKLKKPSQEYQGQSRKCGTITTYKISNLCVCGFLPKRLTTSYHATMQLTPSKQEAERD